MKKQTKVKVSQGFNKFTFGEVLDFTTDKNSLGNENNYSILVTGGVNCFNKPAQIGKIITAQSSNVLPI